MQAILRLTQLMRQLRDPEKGCPWDKRQDFNSIVPHTLEEAYELAEAIETGDMEATREELADLLFQLIFYTQLAAEAKAFDLEQVAETLEKKIKARHPHVFGDAKTPPNWESMKAKERQRTATTGTLAGVTRACPALTRAARLQRRAAAVGFDWKETKPVMNKVREELEELQSALDKKENTKRIEEEAGDLLFACVNLIRHLKKDPEATLRRANRKFENRFNQMEKQLTQQGKEIANTTLEELETLWNQAKQEEKKNNPNKDKTANQKTKQAP